MTEDGRRRVEGGELRLNKRDNRIKDGERGLIILKVPRKGCGLSMANQFDDSIIPNQLFNTHIFGDFLTEITMF